MQDLLGVLLNEVHRHVQGLHPTYTYHTPLRDHGLVAGDAHPHHIPKWLVRHMDNSTDQLSYCVPNHLVLENDDNHHKVKMTSQVL